MSKLQTKLAVAFLGSAFFVFMVWDRAGKKSDLEVRPIQDHMSYQDDRDYASERVLRRSKRQAVGNKLNVIYRKFNNLIDCCNVPILISADALTACEATVNQRRGKTKKQRPAQTQTQGRRSLLDAITTLFPIQSRGASVVRQGNNKGGRIVKKGNKKNQRNRKVQIQTRGKRQTPQKIALSSVCYTDCVFSYLNFLNDSAMDLNRIEDSFVGTVNEEWKKTVQDAMYTCEEPAACASPEMINVKGKFCSIKPTIMMNCMRKQMIINCPAKSKTSRDFACNSAVASLKSLNTQVLG